MDNFDLKKYLVENKATANSKLEEASALSIEPYTAENPSGEFEYKVLYYEPGKNQPTYQSLHKYLPTLSGAFLVLNSAKKIGVNTTDGKIANKVEPRTVVDKNGKTVDFKDESREDARAAFSKAGYRDYTGNQVGNINEAILSKDDFDLKKYLVESKVTTNSRMLNEEETANKSFPEAVLDAWGEFSFFPLRYSDAEGLMDFIEGGKDRELKPYKDQIEQMLDLPGRQSRAAFQKLYDDLMNMAYGEDEEEEYEDED